jgi:hypothetical protein
MKLVDGLLLADDLAGLVDGRLYAVAARTRLHVS